MAEVFGQVRVQDDATDLAPLYGATQSTIEEKSIVALYQLLLGQDL